MKTLDSMGAGEGPRGTAEKRPFAMRILRDPPRGVGRIVDVRARNKGEEERRRV